MSIFAKKIPKSEIDVIYKQVQEIADILMTKSDNFFHSLFENENEEDKSFRLFSAEVHALYALSDIWKKNGVPIRTVIGRIADIKELLADKHNYPYDVASNFYNSVKDRIEKDKGNYSTDDVAMAYANSFFDSTITLALEDNGISFEEVGYDYLGIVCVSIAGAFIRAEKIAMSK